MGGIMLLRFVSVAIGSVQLLGSVQLQCPPVGEPLEWTVLWL